MLRGMLSQIAMRGYEKLMLANLMECAVRGTLQIGGIKIYGEYQK